MRDSCDVRRDLHRIDLELDLVECQRLFGARFSRAWELLKGRRVNKHLFHPSGRVMWTVNGSKGEYRIMPAAAYCGCDDFYFAVISGESNACQHLIAQRLAALLLDYEVVNIDDSQYMATSIDMRTIDCATGYLTRGYPS